MQRFDNASQSTIVAVRPGLPDPDPARAHQSDDSPASVAAVEAIRLLAAAAAGLPAAGGVVVAARDGEAAAVPRREPS